MLCGIYESCGDTADHSGKDHRSVEVSSHPCRSEKSESYATYDEGRCRIVDEDEKTFKLSFGDASVIIKSDGGRRANWISADKSEDDRTYGSRTRSK